jgi:branched-chain amino acid transport system ATP-binding protein
MAMAEAILQLHHLTKTFGGLAAVEDASLDVGVGEIHAVIGPNGAGKTTLTNLISGDLAVSSGEILFHGQNISHLPPEQRSRLGIGRSYQKTNIFPSFSALENCRLAAQSRTPHVLRWWRDAQSYRDIRARAEQALAAVNLSGRATDLALSLSHGEQRQLEIAMCLATDPTLLLLDEPLAGMGREEAAKMVELIRTLGASHAVLLVEHDMDAVFQLAQRLTVMVDGRILASGIPAEIRANRDVQIAYLGEMEPSA